jgi:hypothetical protein
MPAYTRSAAAQEAYEAALTETRAAWYSVEDAIRVRVFGWDRTRGVDGRWIAIRMMGGQRRRVLEPNPYPYEVPTGIEHWILWSEEAMSAREVDNFLERKAPAWVTGWTWQRNPPAARSVPGLWHVQVYFTRG